MADVAQLGIAVDSSQVIKAKDELTKLSGAAKMAESASENFSGTSKKLAGVALAAARAVSDQAAASLALARASGTASKEDMKAATASLARAKAATATAKALYSQAAAQDAANNNRPPPVPQQPGRPGGANNFYVGNLAAQFQDIAVTSAMMQNPLQIALQQGTQISAVLGPMGAAGAAATLKAALVSIITPFSLFVIGAVGAVAALLQLVNWGKLASSMLNTLADVLQPIAPYAVAAAAGLALLYAPAILSGGFAVITMLSSMTAAALRLAVAFALANPAVALLAGFVAVVAAANIFRDELTKILGFDIVKVAKDAANFLVGAFVGAYNAIKIYWGALPSAIGEIAIGTVNVVISKMESMVNSAIALINKVIAAGNKLPGVNVGEIGKANVGRLSNPYSGTVANGAADISKAFSSAQGTDYVGGTLAAIEKGASVASAKLRELADGLGKVDDKTKKRRGKTEAQRFEDIMVDAQGEIARLKAEEAGLYLTAEAAAKLRYETELLNRAKQADITLSDGQRSKLMAVAAEMAAVETATIKARDALDFAKDASRGFIDDLRQGLMDGKGLFESFGNAVNGVLDKIINKLQDNLIDALFSSSGLGGGSGGGIFGSIGKMLGFAGGGYTGGGAASKAAGIVHGGEYVFSKRATDKIGVGNLEKMHRSAKGYSGGGHVAPVQSGGMISGGGVTITYAPQINAQGASSEMLPQIKGYIDDQYKQFRRDVPGIINNGENRGTIKRRG